MLHSDGSPKKSSRAVGVFKNAGFWRWPKNSSIMGDFLKMLDSDGEPQKFHKKGGYFLKIPDCDGNPAKSLKSGSFFKNAGF